MKPYTWHSICRKLLQNIVFEKQIRLALFCPQHYSASWPANPTEVYSLCGPLYNMGSCIANEQWLGSLLLLFDGVTISVIGPGCCMITRATSTACFGLLPLTENLELPESCEKCHLWKRQALRHIQFISQGEPGNEAGLNIIQCMYSPSCLHT